MLLVGCGHHHKNHQSVPDNPSDVPEIVELTVNVPITAHIDSVGEVDWYSIELFADVVYHVRTFNLSADMDSTVFISQGVVLAQDDFNSVYSDIEFIPDRDGTYRITVSHSDPFGSSGMYDLIVETDCKNVPGGPAWTLPGGPPDKDCD